MREEIKKHLSINIEEILSLRKEIHKNPELGYNEHNTTVLIKSYLENNGLNFIPFNGTGGYVYIDNGSDTTYAFRGDIDALPIVEKTECDFSSTINGVMHACGHDAHSCVAAGVAVMYNRLKNYGQVNLLVLFQPAEECNPTGGARIIIESGILNKYHVKAIYGLHMWPEYSVGDIAIKQDVLMGSSDKFSVKVLGKNSHAAQPNNGVDAISISADIVNALVHKIKREVDPFSTTLVSIGAINSVGRYNIVCGEVNIEGTIRTDSKDAREYIHKRIETLSQGIAQTYGGTVEVCVNTGYSVVYNDPMETEKFTLYAKEHLGENHVHTKINSTLIGEDFSFFSQVIPSVYFFMGCECKYPLHSNKFIVKEETIPKALQLMCGYFLNLR